MPDLTTATGSSLSMTTTSKHWLATVHQPDGTELPIGAGDPLPTSPKGLYTLKVRDTTLAKFSVTVEGDNPKLTDPISDIREGTQRVWIDYLVEDGFTT